MTIEIFTTGYPRSGNTWLGRLLSDILDSPMQAWNDDTVVYDHCQTGQGGYLIRKTHIPAFNTKAFGEIAQRGPVIFIQRDPRDVAVSAMFYRNLQPTDDNLMKVIKTMTDRQTEVLRKHAIYHELGAYEAWIRSCTKMARRDIWCISYESLHKYPVLVLGSICISLLKHYIDINDLKAAYNRQNFDKHKAKHSHSMRKGIVGDWKNYFKRRHGEYINNHLYDIMIENGYINDGDWWMRLPE